LVAFCSLPASFCNNQACRHTDVLYRMGLDRCINREIQLPASHYLRNLISGKQVKSTACTDIMTFMNRVELLTSFHLTENHRPSCASPLFAEATRKSAPEAVLAKTRTDSVLSDTWIAGWTPESFCSISVFFLWTNIGAHVLLS
jgi:hypothetical protein